MSASHLQHISSIVQVMAFIVYITHLAAGRGLGDMHLYELGLQTWEEPWSDIICLAAGRQMGDVHRFDLVSKTWEEVKTPANPLPPRSMFGGAHVMGRLLVVACGAVRMLHHPAWLS